MCEIVDETSNVEGHPTQRIYDFKSFHVVLLCFASERNLTALWQVYKSMLVLEHYQNLSIISVKFNKSST